MDKKNFAITPRNREKRNLNTRWYVEWYEVNLLGENYRKRISIPDLPTIAEREAAGQKIIDELSQASGYIGKLSRLLQSLNKTLGEASPYQSHETQVIYKNYLRNFVDYVKHLDSYDIAPFVKYLVEMNYAPSTINAHIALLRMLFSKLKKKKLIAENPCDDIAKLKERRQHGKIFSVEQRELVKQKINQHAPELMLPVKYLFYCFIRPNELRNLRVRDVSFADGCIRISAGIAKDADQRIINIPDAFLAELKKLRIDLFPDEYFLTGRNGLPAKQQVGKNYFYKRHCKVLQSLNLKGFYLYSWKHTGNFFAQQRGIPMKELQLHNGHSDLRTTDNYLGRMTAMDCPNVRSNFPEF